MPTASESGGGGEAPKKLLYRRALIIYQTLALCLGRSLKSLLTTKPHTHTQHLIKVPVYSVGGLLWTGFCRTHKNRAERLFLNVFEDRCNPENMRCVFKGNASCFGGGLGNSRSVLTFFNSSFLVEKIHPIGLGSGLGLGLGVGYFKDLLCVLSFFVPSFRESPP